MPVFSNRISPELIRPGALTMGALCVLRRIYLRRLVNLFFLYVLRLNDLRLKVYCRGDVAPYPLRFLMKHLRLTYGAISDFCEEKSALSISSHRTQVVGNARTHLCSVEKDGWKEVSTLVK